MTIKEDGAVVIASEADAYAILEETLSSRGLLALERVSFKGWPVLTVHLKGEQFDQTLTAPVMRSLLEYQTAVYHAYAVSRYGSSKKRLSPDEKRALEMRVRVEGGSTGLEIDAQALALEFMNKMAGKMDSDQILIAVLSFLVLYFGTSAFRSFLEHRKETRLKEVSDETQQKTLETLKFVSAEETKRTAILARAAEDNRKIAEMAFEAYGAHTELLRAVAEGEEGKVNDVSVKGPAAMTLIHNARRQSKTVRLDGRYTLQKLDWSDPSRFRVKARHVTTGLEFEADVHDETLTGEYKERLKQAEWARSPVQLVVNGQQLGDEIRSATIIKVEEVPAEPKKKTAD